MIPFADNFLAGGLISLLIPAGVLVAVAVWYTRTVLKREHDREHGEEAAAGGASGPGTSRATPGASQATP